MLHAMLTVISAASWSALQSDWLCCAGKYMLAHAASAQGISAVENICDRPYILNHNSVPAACFTHPEVRFPQETADIFQEPVLDQLA